MLNDINNFIKWLTLKAFIINKVSSATKLQVFSFFGMESVFSLVISTLSVI